MQDWPRALEAPNAVSKVRAKVNPPSPNYRLLIALRSPSAFRETGLRMCPPEKSQESDSPRRRAVHSLQSDLRTKYYEIRACVAYFGVRGGGISLQLRLAGGESGIRTHVRVSPKHAFQACAFSHSAISPARLDGRNSPERSVSTLPRIQAILRLLRLFNSMGKQRQLQLVGGNGSGSVWPSCGRHPKRGRSSGAARDLPRNTAVGDPSRR